MKDCTATSSGNDLLWSSFSLLWWVKLAPAALELQAWRAPRLIPGLRLRVPVYTLLKTRACLKRSKWSHTSVDVCVFFFVCLRCCLLVFTHSNSQIRYWQEKSLPNQVYGRSYPSLHLKLNWWLCLIFSLTRFIAILVLNHIPRQYIFNGFRK